MAKASKKLSDLQKAVIDHTAVGYQLIHIQTMEELRALSQLQEVAATLQQAKATPTMTAAWLAETTFPMVTWDRINGYRLHLRSHDMTEEQMMETFGHVPDAADLPRLTDTASKVQLMANPSAAIAELLAPPANGHEGSILQNTNAGVYVFLDLDQWFDNSAIGQRLERQLFEAAQYRQLNHVEAQRLVVILSTENKLSQRLRRMSANLRMELPDEHGMATVLDQMLTGMSTVEYADSELRSELTRAMLGLGSLEAENAAALAVNSGVSRDKAGQPFVRVTREAIPRIHDAKAELIQQGGVLEYVPTKDLPKREDIGGYRGLLQAVDEWRVAMSPASRELGVTPPRGMALLGLPGTGKCLGRGTPVLMFNGTVKPVELVSVGDLLMGPDGQPRTVLTTTAGHGPLYRVKPRKGAAYVVNSAHILSLKKTGTNRIVNMDVSAYSALGAATRARLKGWRTGVNWQKQDVTIPPYILGAWLGDGSNYNPDFTNADKAVLEEVEKYANTVGLNFRWRATRGKTQTYAVCKEKGGNPRGNCFWEALKAYKLPRNKHIPRAYLANDRATRLELLAGLIDTDGSLSCGGYEISTKYGALAADILFLARSLGLAAYSKQGFKCDTASKKGGLYHRIFISGDCDMVPVRLSHKKAPPRQQRKDVLKTGITVTAIGPGDYFGFTLSGDHLFLLGDFTVTHNSMVASSLAGMFELPLYKLDIGAVMSKYVGDTEARIRQALEQVDSQRGAVVLLDEIDKTLSSAHEASGDSGASSRVLSYLLTWMATQNSGAFTVMTLNRISTIAPEILRAGRVDAVFFTELPTPEQRTEIFKIHMRKAKIDSTVYGPSDWAKLLEESDKLTGGEIETMVKTAQYRALAVSGTLQPALDHYTLARTRITPVAELNAEQVDNMRKACKGAISVNEALAVPQARAGRAARRLSGNNLNTN